MPDSVQSPRIVLRFAVRPLSDAIDRENTLRERELVCRSPHPPRSGPPSPKRQSEEWRVEISARLLKHTFEYRAPLLTIDY